MSIINDALKKTQSDLLTKALKPSAQEEKKPTPAQATLPLRSSGPAAPESAQLKKTTKRSVDRTQVLLGITIGFCVCLLAGMILIFNQISSHGLATTSRKAVRRPHKNSSSEIVISGVITRNNKNVALINNEIYEVGETINGKKIVNITLEKVELLDGGKIKSYPVHKKN